VVQRTVYSYKKILFYSNGLKSGFCHLMLLNVRFCILVIMLLTNCNHQYTLNGVDLELLGDIRDLGIQIDSKLKFHVHTNSVANKANCILGLISKVFECKDSDIMLKLYKSLVCPGPILDEYSMILGPNYVMDKQKVKAIQRRATKMIFTCHDLPYHDRLSYLKLP